jgi:hypothetical protein
MVTLIVLLDMVIVIIGEEEAIKFLYEIFCILVNGIFCYMINKSDEKHSCYFECQSFLLTAELME